MKLEACLQHEIVRENFVKKLFFDSPRNMIFVLGHSFTAMIVNASEVLNVLIGMPVNPVMVNR